MNCFRTFCNWLRLKLVEDQADSLEELLTMARSATLQPVIKVLGTIEPNHFGQLEPVIQWKLEKPGRATYTKAVTMSHYSSQGMCEAADDAAERWYKANHRQFPGVLFILSREPSEEELGDINLQHACQEV